MADPENVMSTRSTVQRARPAIAALMALATSALAFAAPPDPLDARAATKPLQHRSAFDGYRRFADEQPMNWRDANDTVKRIGGWRSYAREGAPSAAPAPSAATSPAPPPVPSTPAPAAPPVHKH
jgi:hypothetical protein